MPRLPRALALVGSLGLAAAIALSAAPAAHAADDSIPVTLEIEAGTLDVVIDNVIWDAPLAEQTYSHALQTRTADITLSVDDSTGSGAGWNVTVQSTVLDFTANGDTDLDIPASALLVTSAAAPEYGAGQAIDNDNGPRVPAAVTNLSLEQARMVLQAAPDYGLGEYTQALGVKLDIPAQARAGSYSGNIIVTLTAGPDAPVAP